MRVGIVGSGFMAAVHLNAWLRTDAQLVGLISLDPPSAERLAAQANVRIYPTLDALLDDVDVIDICTPTYLHHEHVLAAAAKGKHIICEKPLARTIEQGIEMIRVCREAGVKLLIAHVVRFFPEYASAKEIVDRGDIGRVAVMRLTRCSFKPGGNQPNSWFHDTEKSGGMMLDLMVHDFDYARWVAGDVESVYAQSVTGKDPSAPLDYALVTLKHRNGALSNVEGSWAYPPPLFRTALEIAGSEGLIEHPTGSSTPLEIYFHKKPDAQADIAVPTSPLLEDPYTAEIRHFVEVLEHGAAPRVTAEDALAALAIGMAAIESAQTGQPVTPVTNGDI